MEASAQETKCLVEVLLAIILAIATSQFDTLGKKPSDVECAGHDVRVLVGNVVLHSGLFVNGQLHTFVNRSPQASVVLASILVVGVVLGIVDMVYATTI